MSRKHKRIKHRHRNKYKPSTPTTLSTLSKQGDPMVDEYTIAESIYEKAKGRVNYPLSLAIGVLLEMKAYFGQDPLTEKYRKHIKRAANEAAQSEYAVRLFRWVLGGKEYPRRMSRKTKDFLIGDFAWYLYGELKKQGRIKEAFRVLNDGAGYIMDRFKRDNKDGFYVYYRELFEVMRKLGKEYEDEAKDIARGMLRKFGTRRTILFIKTVRAAWDSGLDLEVNLEMISGLSMRRLPPRVRRKVEEEWEKLTSMHPDKIPEGLRLRE